MSPALPRPGSRLRNALLLGLVCAALGVALRISPWGGAWEENLGLGWLFRLRGPIRPPEDVVVVSIDKRSSRSLGLPYDTTEWPRRLHARLLDGLSQADPRLVVFDLWFRRSRPSEDRAFAEAMRRAGNVLVLEHLSKCGEIAVGQLTGTELDPCNDVLDDGPTGPRNIAVHRLLPPNPKLATAAAGSAPFTLPDRPSPVGQFWTFDQNAGGLPSLPTLALLLAARDELEARFDDRPREPNNDGSPGTIDGIRRALAKGSLTDIALTLSAALDRRDEATLARLRTGRRIDAGYLPALRAALAPPTSRYLNFYGPPLTLRTLSYSETLHRLTAGEPALLQALREKAVFIGLSSPVQWQQMDEFTTVFSDPESGHDISGIEILATAYANLRQGVSLRPLSPTRTVLAVFGWGLLVALLARLTPPLLGLPLAIGAGAAWLAAAVALFGAYQLWLPVAVPLLGQLPVALLGATGLHYLEAKRDRKRLHTLFRHYLPDAVVERLVRQGGSPFDEHETVFGVALYADAENYTALAESMPPAQLAHYMNTYYEALFAPVRAQQGNVSDVVGDAMLAIWASRGDDREIRAQACRAALGMLAAIDELGRHNGRQALRSRIGIHCGSLALAHVGAHDHYEYRAVGDIVNTSSRLEELNKELGTRILISAEIIEGLDGFEVRPLGEFQLRGKTAAVEVYELLGPARLES